MAEKSRSNSKGSSDGRLSRSTITVSLLTETSLPSPSNVIRPVPTVTSLPVTGLLSPESPNQR